MARKTAKKLIGGHEIALKQWGAFDGLEYMAMAGRLLGDALMQAIDPETGRPRDDANMAAMMIALCRGAKGGEARSFVRALAEAATIRIATKDAHGATMWLEPIPLAPMFDEHFAGEWQQLGEFIAFGVQHNMGSFLAAGGSSQAFPASSENTAPPRSSVE